MLSLGETLLLTQILASIAVGINALETFFGYNNYKEGQFFDWTVLRSGYAFSTHGPIAAILDKLFRPATYRFFQLFQLTVALLLITDAFPSLRFLLCLLTLVCLLLFGVRHVVGTEGSDQMLMIVFFALTIAYSHPSPLLQKICLGFIFIQLMLSYLVAGIAKLISPAWRDGTALIEINRAESFGNHAVFLFLRNRPLVSKSLGISVIIFEVAFPFLTLFGQPYVYIFAGTAVFFHLFVTITMRLNTFFWTFLAAIPSILFFSLNACDCRA